MNCPKCGKPMVEQVKCAGMWLCVDYLKPLNDAAPFEYACTGKHLTPEFYVALEAELNRLANEEHARAVKLN